jgi:putative lipoic acid-binding regulatory protein
VNERESPLQFPCRFPIKIMGKKQPGFRNHVIGLISTHVSGIAETDIVTRRSSNGNFMGLTVTVSAESREQLDKIYFSLTSSKRVLFVL